MRTVLLPLVALPSRICGQAASCRFTAKGDRAGALINVYFCAACNAHFAAPPEFDYEKEEEGLIAYYEAHRDCILWRHKRIFDNLKKVIGLERGRFLDIGSRVDYSPEVAAKCG